MASSVRPVVRLATRPQVVHSLVHSSRSSSILRATSQFHTSTSRYATPSGPPPQGFRLPRPARFDEGQGAMDKASNYFLLTEIFRGMYVVLEQFFRPPYVCPFASKILFLRYFQLHDILSFRERSHLTPLPWRTRSPSLPFRRRTMHRLQTLRSHLPGASHHD